MMLALSLSVEAQHTIGSNNQGHTQIHSTDGEKVMYFVANDERMTYRTLAEVLRQVPGIEIDMEGNISYYGRRDVVLWINNRPSHMEGEALRQYVKTMPASRLESIEVLNNPSDRYRVSGQIINLVTRSEGVTNEMLSVGLSSSTSPWVAPWVSYVRSDEKVNISAWANASYGRYVSQRVDTMSLLAINGDLSSTQGSENEIEHTLKSANIGFSIDWMIDSSTSAGFELGISPQRNAQTGSGEVVRNEYINHPFQHNYRLEVDNLLRQAEGVGGLWLQHDFDTLGQRLRISFNSSYAHSKLLDDRQRYYADFPVMNQYNRERQDLKALKSDIGVEYTKPWSEKGKMELGAILAWNDGSCHRKWDTLNYSSNVLLPDAARSFSNDISDVSMGGYFSLQQQWGRFTLKGGLRTDRQRIRLNYYNLPASSINYDVDRLFWKFSPSVYAAYNIKDNNTIYIGYTLHTLAPEAEMLGGYAIVNEENYSMGNPNLQLGYTHHFQGGWNMNQEWGNIGLQGYLKVHSGEIASFADAAFYPYFGKVVDVERYCNINASRKMGGEMNVTFAPSSNLNISLYAGVWDYYYRAEYRTGIWDERHMTSFDARLNLWAKLWDVLQVYTNIYYATPGLLLLTGVDDDFMVDLGVSTDLLDDRLSLSVEITDLLLYDGDSGSSLNPYNRSSFDMVFNSRNIVLGITWRIGRTALTEKANEGVEVPSLE